MARKTFSMIGAVVARLTKLDECGRIDYGDRSRIVTEGFVTVAATADIDEGDAVEVPNANGKVVARRAAQPKNNGWTVEITWVGVHPDALNFSTAQPTKVNGVGDVAGIAVDEDVDASDANYALELWSTVGDGDPCAPSGGVAVPYVLFPWLRGGTVGDFTAENDAINFVSSNCHSKAGHAWDEGPYMVDVDATAAPIPLADPMAPSETLLSILVGLNPPEPGLDGAIPLDDPAATASTGATAGSPGSFTPANSFRPETIDDMTGITATPATAWTAGQFVMMQDGNPAYWNGTAWVAGIAP